MATAKTSASRPLNTSGLDKADLLAALYNAAKPGASDAFNTRTAPMTGSEAQDIINRTKGPLCFTYVKGRALMVNITGDALDTAKYDEKNGKNAAKEVVARLRQPHSSQPTAKSAATVALRM